MDVTKTYETGADCPTCDGSGLVGPAGHWTPCDAEGDNDCGEWYCNDGIVTNGDECWLFGVPHVHVGGRPASPPSFDSDGDYFLADPRGGGVVVMTETYDGWGLTDSDYNPPTIPTPNALTKILETAVAPFGCVVSYDNTGGNCGAVGVYRSDASGMGEPVGAYLLVSGSEGPWPYSSAAEPLDVQWSDDDVDPDWDAFAVFMYSDEVEAFPFAAVRGVDALVTVVVGWGRVQS